MAIDALNHRAEGLLGVKEAMRRFSAFYLLLPFCG